MVMETIGSSEDIAQENEDIRRVYPDFSESISLKLGFFSKRFRTLRGLATARDDEFLGYAIVKRDRLPRSERAVRVYESVLRPSRHPNNYIHRSQGWTCRLAERDFVVDGYLYAQQNNLTNVCAHVALRTAAAPFHSEGDMLYREMNSLAGIELGPGEGQRARGLDVREMVGILEAAGARCFVADYTQTTHDRQGIPFQKYVYGSVESGFPAIVGFSASEDRGRHAIPLFGHTFNEDTWVPKAELSYFRVGDEISYVPSESWVSMYIAHDDNWGSNFCIPRGYLHLQRWCGRLAQGGEPCPIEDEQVACAIGTMPGDVRLNPIEAEVIGADYLFSMLPRVSDLPEPWAHRLDWYARNSRLVLRPLLVERERYCEHLRAVTSWDGGTVEAGLVDVLARQLPMRFWLVELSVPELYSANRRKIAEVLLRSDTPPKRKREMGSFILARLPGDFVLHESGGAKNPKYRFLDCGCHGHVELLGCENG